MTTRPCKSPLIEELKREARPGHCICCDGPFPPQKTRRQRVICDSLECWRLWHRFWKAGRRLAEKEARDG